jgi:hypothetical protein
MTQTSVADDLTSIYCPQCGEEVEDVPPVNYLFQTVRADYRHVSDGTALCPLISRQGWRPAEPVERQAGT